MNQIYLYGGTDMTENNQIHFGGRYLYGITFSNYNSKVNHFIINFSDIGFPKVLGERESFKNIQVCFLPIFLKLLC